MSLKIRLRRIGKRKNPFYRIIVTNALWPRNGKILDSIGTYNPLLDFDKKKIILSYNKAIYWLKTGAKATDSIAKFILALKTAE